MHTHTLAHTLGWPSLFARGAGGGGATVIEEDVTGVPDGDPVVIADPTAPDGQETCYTATAVGDVSTPAAPVIETLGKGAGNGNEIRTNKPAGADKIKVYRGGKTDPPAPFESGESNTSCADPTVLALELSAVAADGSVVLTWKKWAGEDGVTIYYDTDSGAPYANSENVPTGSLTDNGDGTWSYTVTGLTNGTPYYFAVEPYHSV